MFLDHMDWIKVKTWGGELAKGMKSTDCPLSEKALLLHQSTNFAINSGICIFSANRHLLSSQLSQILLHDKAQQTLVACNDENYCHPSLQ